MSAFRKITILLVIVLSLFSMEIFFVNYIYAVSTASIAAQVRITICGNWIVEDGEDCDLTNLDGYTCSSFGYNSGELLCTPACTFDQSNCFNQSGGGGGGGGIIAPQTNTVNVTGQAFPLSKIILLKDGQKSAETISGPDAKFNLSLSGLAPGNYNFSIQGIDPQGNQTPLFKFTVTLTTGVTANVSGVFLPPTIAIDNTQVIRGENITIFGLTIPDSQIIVNINSEKSLFIPTKANANGAYLLRFDTSPLEEGPHSARSKTQTSTDISEYSALVNFSVGQTTEPALCKKGDLNSDNVVNLIDFSIAAYWYKKTLSPKMLEKEKCALNGDGIINLQDFSIMAYYWNG